jgi:hypothetical protein
VEVDNRLALGLIDPVIAWNERIVLIGFAVALGPVVELAARDAEPADESLRR